MGKYFAYARVSTPRQGEKGVSLQEQRAAIERYANSHGLEVTRWFEERESASHAGRPAFTQMLRLLRLGKGQGVVIHKIDRSARNLQDWADVGRLADSGVEIHFANENVDLRTVGGRLAADIQAVVAAHYSRNLREEVRKGVYGRLKQGLYPFYAPIGYLDQGSGKPKIPDPAVAPLIQEAFQMYVSGRYSLPHLAVEMARRGLRNRTGGAVSVNGLARLLKNSFYIGLIRILRNGQTYQGVHEPLVTTELFNKAQQVLAGKRVDRVVNHVFTYCRIVRCATCGYSLIGERQKGHVYYRCHNRPFKQPAKCPPTSIREERLDELTEECLSGVDLTENEAAVARVTIEARKRDLEADKGAAVQAIHLQLDGIKGRLAKLTDLLLDGAIDNDLFQGKHHALLLEQAGLKERLAETQNNPSSTLATIESTVELAKSPSIVYKTASPAKRRELLKVLLSNLAVSGKNVEITLALPFRLIAERHKPSIGRPDRGTCRTWEQILQQIINDSVTQGAPTR